MKIAKIAFVVAVLLMGLQSRTCRACATPRRPPDLPCIGFVGNSLVLELGTIFQTNSPHSCAAAIGLLGAPIGLDFTMAKIGKVNTLTNDFTSTFQLNRFAVSDATWASGVDMNLTQPLPGATWFGFSDLNVPPVMPPTLGANEIFAIRFTILGMFIPSQIENLQVQYGSGAGTGAGLPDFNHMADLAHSSQYSGIVTVPGFGTNNWSVPEPATWIYAISALAFVAGSSGIRRFRFGCGRQRQS